MGVDSGFVAVFDNDGSVRWSAAVDGAHVEFLRGVSNPMHLADAEAAAEAESEQHV